MKVMGTSAINFFFFAVEIAVHFHFSQSVVNSYIVSLNGCLIITVDSTNEDIIWFAIIFNLTVIQSITDECKLQT